MSEEIVVYLQLDSAASAANVASDVASSIGSLDGVQHVTAQVEDVERGAAETLQEVTLTITALGGAVGATTALVAQIRGLVAALSPRSAVVETEEDTTQLKVGAPKNENPAQ